MAFYDSWTLREDSPSAVFYGQPYPGYYPMEMPKDAARGYYNVSLATTSLPDPGCFQFKQISSELHRVDSGLSMSAFSPGYDDNYCSPASSDLAGYSPQVYPNVHYNYSPEPCLPACISMHDVQGFVDTPSEHGYHDIDHGMYSKYAPPQEGYYPMTSDLGDHTEIVEAMDDTTTSISDRSPVESPTLRQRKPARTSTQRSVTSNSNRIGKRHTPRRSATFSTITADSEVENEEVDEENITARPFSCPLAPNGCQSTFCSKNEWKRHFSTQHLRLGYWRCDQCETLPNKKHNDFNRRDLFVQHVRRMHCKVPDTAVAKVTTTSRKGRVKPSKNEDFEPEIAKAAERCYKRLRTPPVKSICVVCEVSFSGPTSWDERMEHLGRHFESAKRENADNASALDYKRWAIDVDAVKWMITEGILTPEGDIVIAGDT